MSMPSSIPSQLSGGGYYLVWCDDFSEYQAINPATGNRIDPNKWNQTCWGRPVGANGNCRYPSTSGNYSQITVSNSCCVIKANNTTPGTYPGVWNGGCLGTNAGPIITFYGGFFEFKSQYTFGHGFFPAGWMFNNNASGNNDEQDVFEFNGATNNCAQAINVGATWYKVTPPAPPFGFNLYQDWWQPGSTSIMYTNGTETVSSPGGSTDSDVYLLLNFDVAASSGYDACCPDNTTPDPAYLWTDYVRVFQNSTGNRYASPPTNFILTGSGSGNGGVQTQCGIFLNGPAPAAGVVYTPTSTLAGGGNTDTFQMTLGGPNVSQIPIPSGSGFVNFYMTPSGASGTRFIAGTTAIPSSSSLTNIGSIVTFTATGSDPTSTANSAAILLSL